MGIKSTIDVARALAESMARDRIKCACNCQCKAHVADMPDDKLENLLEAQDEAEGNIFTNYLIETD